MVIWRRNWSLNRWVNFVCTKLNQFACQHAVLGHQVWKDLITCMNCSVILLQLYKITCPLADSWQQTVSKYANKFTNLYSFISLYLYTSDLHDSQSSDCAESRKRAVKGGVWITFHSREKSIEQVMFLLIWLLPAHIVWLTMCTWGHFRAFSQQLKWKQYEL